ncbi:BMP6 [Branchiostoma lanceolatum]|uniref:BMP6 protein n=1 Tax=Branchiostoma lanceolatum TaxID=7740 RepID=A0A8J9YZ11_BRALA|nr:BMP6 [Branchiostoma lanceolatum]
MARFVKTFVLVLLVLAASQAFGMSKTQARRTRRAESLEGSERTAAGMVVRSTVRNMSYPREEERGAPRSIGGRVGVKPGTEMENTRAQRTVSQIKPTDKACSRGRCRRGGTGRKARCPRRRSRPGPPVVHLYMRYLTWRSNWQPGGRRWREQALRNSTVYQVLPWKVSWRRGVGNFKFKVNCHVSKVNVVRESELVLTFSTTFQSAVRRGTLQPPYRLVLLKVVQRSGVRTHRHVATKTLFGNETAPWVIFNISRLVQTWRESPRLKHCLRLTVVSMATGLQVDRRVTRRLFDTRREATLLAAYVREGGGLKQKEDVFSDRHGNKPRRMEKEGKAIASPQLSLDLFSDRHGNRPRLTIKEGKTRASPRLSLDERRVQSLAVLQRVLLGNNTGHASDEGKPRGPELLRDWLAYRERKRSRQVAHRYYNDTGSEVRGRRQVRDCRRHDYYVVFDDIIQPEFILQPPRYNAGRCRGTCGRPFPTHVNSTNHALLMSLLHERDPRVVPAPCCVPVAYSPISVMEQHGDNIKVKPYPNMRVDACGCR